MRLPNISTRELNNFTILAGSQSFKDAANLCSLSQPALSLQIKQLETKLGAKLILRSGTRGKAIELTSEGTEFLHAAHHALRIFQESIQRIRPTRQPDRPSLRVACLPSLLFEVISPVLADLVRAHPEAQISVFDSDSSACSTLLVERKCDAAVCSRPVNGQNIRSQYLFAERFCAILNRQDPRTRKQALTLDDFTGSTVVNLSDNLAVQHSLAVRSIPCIQVNTITSLESMLVQGVGAAIVATSTAGLIHHSSLISVPLADAEVTRQIFQSWIEGPPNALLQTFISRLTERALLGM